MSLKKTVDEKEKKVFVSQTYPGYISYLQNGN